MFDPPGGQFASARQVVLSGANGGATIYYTRDGSPPNASSTRYTGPITVSATEPIRAIAIRSGWLDSRVSSQAYFIGSGHTVPILSVMTDPDNLYDPQTGIYVQGNNGISAIVSTTRPTGTRTGSVRSP